MYRGKIYVLNSNELKNKVLREMHNVPYVGNSRYQKTIVALRSQYFFSIMKKEVANYIAIFLECQKVKTEHRHPTRLLYPLPIPQWKWEVVTMDFMTKLPIIVKQQDSIMVVVDKLTKETHFIPVKTTHKETNIAEIYMKEVDKIHGVPKAIVPDRHPIFGKVCSRDLGHSTVYHPKSYEKKERNNKVIDDMFRMYVLDQPSKGGDYIYLVEFSYNNGYWASLK
jgi:hypothetical protein